MKDFTAKIINIVFYYKQHCKIANKKISNKSAKTKQNGYF